MRLDHDTTTTTGTLNLPTHNMRLDEHAMSKFMTMLSSMYEHGFASALREYAANALDSHRAAGIDRPIEVELPSGLSPKLIVRDFGLGLSRTELIDVYSVYGRSTKDTDNDAIGGFGIGAKSAFAIADSFTVRAVKDGRVTTAVFVKDGGSGAPSWLELDGGTGTGEENGVTVTIPVPIDPDEDRHDDATRVFRTWRPGTVLVNGQQPPSVYDEGTELVPGLWVLPLPREDREWWGTRLTLVMGGIGYTIDHASLVRMGLRGLPSGQEVIAEVPIGSVDLSPDRESVQDTTRTKGFLAKIEQRWREEAIPAIRQLIDSEPTAWDAAVKFEAMGKLASDAIGVKGGFRWKGAKVGVIGVGHKGPSSQVGSIHGFDKHAATLVVKEELRGGGGVRSVEATMLGFPERSGLTLVTGCGAEVGRLRRSAIHYLRANKDVKRILFLRDEHGRKQWLSWGQCAHPDGPDEITMGEFEGAVKEWRAKNLTGDGGTKRTTGVKYMGWAIIGTDDWEDAGTYATEYCLRHELEDYYDTILWVKGDRPPREAMSAIAKHLVPDGETAFIVNLTGNMTEGALNNALDTDAEPFWGALRGLLGLLDPEDLYPPGLADELLAVHTSGCWRMADSLKRHGLDRIMPENVKDVIRLGDQLPEVRYPRTDSLKGLANVLPGLNLERAAEVKSVLVSIKERYPLLGPWSVEHRTADHARIYINAVNDHHANKEKEEA